MLLNSNLILPADVGRVQHAVAPVLFLDLLLLFVEEGQLLVAALHIVVQGVQVVPTPLGVVLDKTAKRRN